MEERGRLVRRAVDIVDGLDVDGLMHGAIDVARSTYPHPNPRVGAVIVTPDHTVLSVGACLGDGLAHAETNALDALADRGTARGATMVVTLEPCSHHGRTPPCADALIEAGIAKVVIGALDPNPRVSGSGAQRLMDAGIEVEVGIAESDVIAADPAYFHHLWTGRPRVTLKMATTLDGQVAAADGSSRWITGQKARQDVHVLRSEHDAVLVGAGTVLADNPTLTVRLDGYDGPQPTPVIFAGTRDLPADAVVMARDPLIYTNGGLLVDPLRALDDLGKKQVLSVLVEGGPRIARSFVEARAVDAIVWYVGGKIAGGTGLPAFRGEFATIADAVDLDVDSVTQLGNDVRIDATLRTREA